MVRVTAWIALCRRKSNDGTGFAGWANYLYVIGDPSFTQSLVNTLILVGGVLLITVIGGIFLALLIDQPIWGQGILRIIVISPFFVMPPVAALVWKNMIMHPGYGVFADISKFLGLQPVDWFATYPLWSIVIIVAATSVAVRSAMAPSTVLTIP